MRFIETQSKWGNLYRRAYFVDGKRVSETEFNALFDSEMKFHPKPGFQGKHEKTSYGFRTIWESN